MSRHGRGVCTISVPQAREKEALVKPRPVAPSPSLCVWSSHQPLSFWTGLRKISAPGGGCQMEDDNRQTTAPPTQPGLGRKGPSAPAHWEPLHRQSLVALLRAPFASSSSVGERLCTVPMPQAQGGLFHAPSIPRVCTRRGGGVVGKQRRLAERPWGEGALAIHVTLLQAWCRVSFKKTQVIQ